MDKLRGWDETEHHCQSEGLTMVQLDNEDLVGKHNFSSILNEASHLFPNRKTLAWLGGKAVNFPTWNFLNGTTVTTQQLDAWPNVSLGKWLYRKKMITTIMIFLF